MWHMPWRIQMPCHFHWLQDMPPWPWTEPRVELRNICACNTWTMLAGRPSNSAATFPHRRKLSGLAMSSKHRGLNTKAQAQFAKALQSIATLELVSSIPFPGGFNPDCCCLRLLNIPIPIFQYSYIFNIYLCFVLFCTNRCWHPKSQVILNPSFLQGETCETYWNLLF